MLLCFQLDIIDYFLMRVSNFDMFHRRISAFNRLSGTVFQGKLSLITFDLFSFYITKYSINMNKYKSQKYIIAYYVVKYQIIILISM